MNQIKSTSLNPEILEDCLGQETCFHVMKNKRDITLSLNSGDENKNAKYIADQTPTPTRFIRNCEELGLFEACDSVLKHVNPFEETFRQAIDDKIKRPSILLTTQKSLEVIKSYDEDTLHTPHIIPYNKIANHIDEPVKCKKDNQQIETTANESNTDKQSIVIPPINVSLVSISPGVSIDDKEDISNSKQIFNAELPQTTIIENTFITKNDKVTQKVFRKICPRPTVVSLSNHVVNPIKEKIRESLLKLRYAQIDDNESNVKVPAISIHIPPITKQPTVKDIPKPAIKKQAIKRYAVFHDNSTNERNREAAKRYRHKQKMQQDALLERNAQLETENAVLKKQLQLFQKAHEHCSVSLCKI